MYRRCTCRVAQSITITRPNPSAVATSLPEGSTQSRVTLRRPSRSSPSGRSTSGAGDSSLPSPSSLSPPPPPPALRIFAFAAAAALLPLPLSPTNPKIPSIAPTVNEVTRDATAHAMLARPNERVSDPIGYRASAGETPAARTMCEWRSDRTSNRPAGAG